MSSNINPNNIDGAYPVAGQDNNSQGFRDNFTNIKVNFQSAEDEINDLQTKSLLKAALIGGILDNNMNDNLIYAATIRDFAAPRVQLAPTGSPLTATVNYAAGHYQTLVTSASTTVEFSNFPSLNGLISNYGYVKVQFNITDVSHTITVKASVTGQLLGTAGIQGYVAVNAYTGTISFGAPGIYEFAFGSYDAGATITVFDLNRALTNFVSADIQTDDVTATGFVSAAGNVTGGNLITSGRVTSTGNITGGNIATVGTVSASGNITGGNLVTTGTVSTSGNVAGVNINGFLRPTAGTNLNAPIRLTAGTVLATPAAGAVEYDGTAMYSSVAASQRGVLPSESFIAQSSDYTAANSASAQQVFNATAQGAITLAGSTAYMFEAVYYISRAAGTTSHTLATLFGGTATFTSITYLAETTSTTGNVLGAVSRIYGTGVGALTVTAASTSATENITVILKGMIRTNAGGTVIPQIQYSAAPGGAPTVVRNSYFRLTPVGNSSVVSVGNWS
jgi:hypothetical protein